MSYTSDIFKIRIIEVIIIIPNAYWVLTPDIVGEHLISEELVPIF